MGRAAKYDHQPLLRSQCGGLRDNLKSDQIERDHKVVRLRDRRAAFGPCFIIGAIGLAGGVGEDPPVGLRAKRSEIGFLSNGAR